ncbi:hypothetical protein SAMN04487914_11196 [Arthrobacter sp. ok909]|nr:hypothetical protein SAMN04487914_11196 [Arthrobacter sp. ok909]
MTAVARLLDPAASHPLAGHPLSAAIEAQLPLDIWDLRVFGYAPAASPARFRGRADRAGRGATDISQPRLLSVAKEWVLRGALRRVSARYMDDVVLSLALLSATLRERADAGIDATRLGREDITAHLIRLGQLRESALLSLSGQQRCVRFLNHVLEDLRRWGLTKAGGAAAGLPDSFTLTRADHPGGITRGVDVPGKALPREVVRQLLAPASLALLESGAGRWAGSTENSLLHNCPGVTSPCSGRGRNPGTAFLMCLRRRRVRLVAERTYEHDDEQIAGPDGRSALELPETDVPRCSVRKRRRRPEPTTHRAARPHPIPALGVLASLHNPTQPSGTRVQPKRPIRDDFSSLLRSVAGTGKEVNAARAQAGSGLMLGRTPVGVTMNGTGQNLNNSELAGRVGEAWKLWSIGSRHGRLAR